MSNRNTVLNQVLGRFKIEEGVEPNVDCGACSLAALRPQAQARWANLKCCTFQPFVANFICGAMLEAGYSPQNVLPDRAVLQPLGVLATAEFREFYEATPEDQRGVDHLCSYYDRQARRCGVWQFRPSECSLFYCTGDPQRGRRAALAQQLFQLEAEIAQMALAQLGFSRRQMSEQLDFLNAPPARLTSMAREEVESLYRRAWVWAKGLSPAELFSFISFDTSFSTSFSTSF